MMMNKSVIPFLTAAAALGCFGITKAEAQSVQAQSVIPGGMYPAGQNGCPAAHACFVPNGPSGAANGSTSITMGTVSVSATVTLILAAVAGPFASKEICNLSAAPVYLGSTSSMTTTSSSIILSSSGTYNCWNFTLFPGPIYGEVSTSTDTVGYEYY